MTKRIERMLPLDRKYQLISIKRQTLETMDGVAMHCDNCNTVIINQATIRDNFGNYWTVGLDCVKTLLGSIVNRQFTDDLIYDFNCTLADMKLMSDPNTDIEILENAYRLKYRTKAGRLGTKLVFKSAFEKFDISFDAMPAA